MSCKGSPTSSASARISLVTDESHFSLASLNSSVSQDEFFRCREHSDLVLKRMQGMCVWFGFSLSLGHGQYCFSLCFPHHPFPAKGRGIKVCRVSQTYCGTHIFYIFPCSFIWLIYWSVLSFWYYITNQQSKKKTFIANYCGRSQKGIREKPLTSPPKAYSRSLCSRCSMF